MRGHDLHSLIQAFVLSRFVYSLMYLFLSRTEEDEVNSFIHLAYKLALSFSTSTSTTWLLSMGIHSSLTELRQAHRSAQLLSLCRTRPVPAHAAHPGNVAANSITHNSTDRASPPPPGMDMGDALLIYHDITLHVIATAQIPFPAPPTLVVLTSGPHLSHSCTSCPLPSRDVLTGLRLKWQLPCHLRAHFIPVPSTPTPCLWTLKESTAVEGCFVQHRAGSSALAGDLDRGRRN
ncbi:hypothetical protein HPB50_020126 [Hyalomma asiaticum]|uniref:Uncharacterized protein n=1 Tax=Hyalomma asiaticum TaxID=266040 RepID=A0ACB7S4K8_HYAAI|nr:hypothetical protein HPB50_020126 [Hyalomma asiaticum]